MKRDIKFSVKKFTASMLAVLTFGFFSMGTGSNNLFISVFDAAASELTSENEAIDESICFDADDFKWTSGLSSGVQYLYNEGTFNYYEQLDENNKAAYDAMKVWLEPTTEEFYITLPVPVEYDTSSTNISSWDDDKKTEFWTLILSNIRDGEIALDYDYPELFWLDSSKINVSLGNVRTSYSFRKGTYTMKISSLKIKGAVKSEYTDVSTAKEFQETYTNAVEDFEVQGNDRYSKIKYIHDFIAQKVTYDLSAPYHDTALGIFIEPYSVVCEGYSKAVKILCDKENIPCIVVVGNINLETNFAHMWNYIQMEDGKWYALDCTWDDLDNDSNPIKYQYFLKGSDSFLSNHTPDTQYISTAFTYPVLSETDYIYQTDTPQVTTTAVTSTVTNISTTLTTSIADQETTITTTGSAVTTLMTSITTTETVPAVLKGDFNADSRIDVSDLVLLQKKLLGVTAITDYDLKAEINNDECINIFDWIELKRILITQ